MEVKEVKKEASYYPNQLRNELPVNLFLSTVITEGAGTKLPHLKEKVYSKMHNTKQYPVGRFQKPISNIL